LTDSVPVNVYTQQSRSISPYRTRGRKKPFREIKLTMRDINFSRVNLQYLICARDLARAYPERAALLLGVPDALSNSLAELSAEDLAAVTQIKTPLLILRQEPWWWNRLFTALRADRPEELQAVLDQAGLIVVNG
jgi:hypothetical protein